MIKVDKKSSTESTKDAITERELVNKDMTILPTSNIVFTAKFTKIATKTLCSDCSSLYPKNTPPSLIFPGSVLSLDFDVAFAMGASSGSSSREFSLVALGSV